MNIEIWAYATKEDEICSAEQFICSVSNEEEAEQELSYAEMENYHAWRTY
ncbi:hypothetical protein [Listeria phage List-36]|uniref:Uncharacterized protein n=5 Tax=Pecentumvirus TaxID=1857844 RepID=A0A5C2IDY4_9CAUD|nr:hypothetical protein AG2_167 [Listeria phage vB_LmoM_AG20]YP_009042981.1 hypothetical protein LP048_173 [Listeria phage LP-048]YP_009043377.1 hypothetical protein HH35_gp001 [Listeria phage List-36]QEP53171.2 hypothetical protein FK485_0171 [Listeria phage LP-039]QNL31940.1 hypothetical protein HUK29_0173 [Listeria phage LP-Mix_6.1]WIW77401.1 hypothetical protein CKA15_190 [Listeria phage cka15]AFJ76102.1 hypothetical protein AG2_167 [Listeria phage vB_LmoM_AG20]AHL19846.1 hypothetical pr